MSRLQYDGEESPSIFARVLDRFGGMMEFLSADRILIPLSYVTILSGITLGAYNLINSRLESKVEVREPIDNLGHIAYDFSKRR